MRCPECNSWYQQHHKCSDCGATLVSEEQLFARLSNMAGKAKAKKIMAKAHIKAEKHSSKIQSVTDKSKIEKRSSFSIEKYIEENPCIFIHKKTFWLPIINLANHDNFSKPASMDILSSCQADETCRILERKLTDVFKAIVSGREVRTIALDDTLLSLLATEVHDYVHRIGNDNIERKAQPIVTVRKTFRWFVYIDQDSFERIFEHTHPSPKPLSLTASKHPRETIEKTFENIIHTLISEKISLSLDFDAQWYSRLLKRENSYSDMEDVDFPVMSLIDAGDMQVDNEEEIIDVYSGVIVCSDSGTVYTTQSGGIACRDRYVKGSLVQTPLLKMDPYLEPPSEHELRTVYDLDDTEIKRLMDKNDQSMQRFYCSEESLVRYFSRYKYGSTCSDGIDSEDADFLDSLFAQCYPNMTVDRERLAQSAEAWVHVLLDGNKSEGEWNSRNKKDAQRGVLIWPNSD